MKVTPSEGQTLIKNPIDAQIAEVAREVALRRNVYPKWVEAKKLHQDTADRQLEAMAGALETLKLVREHRDEFLAIVKKGGGSDEEVVSSEAKHPSQGTGP